MPHWKSRGKGHGSAWDSTHSSSRDVTDLGGAVAAAIEERWHQGRWGAGGGEWWMESHLVFWTSTATYSPLVCGFFGCFCQNLTEASNISVILILPTTKLIQYHVFPHTDCAPVALEPAPLSSSVAYYIALCFFSFILSESIVHTKSLNAEHDLFESTGALILIINSIPSNTMPCQDNLWFLMNAASRELISFFMLWRRVSRKKQDKQKGLFSLSGFHLFFL